MSLGRCDIVELGGIVPQDFSLACRGHPGQRQQLFYGMTISPSLRMAEVGSSDQIVIAQYLDDLFDPRVVLVRGDVTLTLEVLDRMQFQAGNLDPPEATIHPGRQTIQPERCPACPRFQMN